MAKHQKSGFSLTAWRGQNGFTLIELIVLVAILLALAAVAFVVIKPKISQKQGQSTNPAPKVSENQSPRGSGDRFFYDVNYFTEVNKLEIDFKITANDADKKINGLSLDLGTQEPPLEGPTQVRININGKGDGKNDWKCDTQNNTLKCVGTEILQLNLQNSFSIFFSNLKSAPQKLNLNLLEGEKNAVTITPLLQNKK